MKDWLTIMTEWEAICLDSVVWRRSKVSLFQTKVWAEDVTAMFYNRTTSNLKVMNFSVMLVFAATLQLTSSGILMACSEEVPKHVFQQLIATPRQSVLIFFPLFFSLFFAAGSRKHMVCVIVSATGENIQGRQARPSLCSSYRGMLKPNDNDWTELSVGVKAFKAGAKTTSYGNVDCANRAWGEITAGIKILTGWWRESIRKHRLRVRRTVAAEMSQKDTKPS